MRLPTLLSILVVGCTGSRTGYVPGQFSDARAQELIGSPLPSFELPTPRGDTMVSSKGLLGHPAMIVFWATWCPTCLQEVPMLKSLRLRNLKSDLKVVSLSVDESPAPVHLMVERTGIDWPVAVNAAPWFGSQKLESLPQIFLVGRSGKVVDAFTGEVDSAVLAKALEGLLIAP